MDDLPFGNVLNLISQAHSELIPLVIREHCRRVGRRSPWPRSPDAERLLHRVRMWDTDAELRVWLHNRASMRSYRALDDAMKGLLGFLARRDQSDRSARELTAEIVGCPTLSNIVKLALRGPLPPGDASGDAEA
jgi:hypothetical protein